MNRPKRIVRLGAVAMTAALALSACGGDDDAPESSPTNGSSDSSAPAEAGGMQLYFVDGNTADYSADFDPGTLEGVKATYPGAELGDDFKQRLLSVNKNLKDFTY